MKEKVVTNVGSKTLTIEALGDQDRINSILELLKPFGIEEMARTGRIALAVEDKKEK